MTTGTLKPAEHNIPYYKGDVFNKSYTVTDADGNPVDLSAKALTFQVKKKKTDPQANAVIDISTASEISVGGADGNVVTFSGSYDIPERSYYYDLQNTTDGETVMFGLFVVTGDVTRVDA